MRYFAREILNFLQNLLDYRLPVGAGHCGVVSVGPRLSGAKPGSEQCLPPRGKQPHERASFAGWRRSLCAAKRPAPTGRQTPAARRGQDPSLRFAVHGCHVGSGLDRSGHYPRSSPFPGVAHVGAAYMRPAGVRKTGARGPGRGPDMSGPYGSAKAYMRSINKDIAKRSFHEQI